MMFGIFKLRKFDKISRELLNDHINDMANDYEHELTILFENKELISQLMTAQIYAIASDGCKGRLRIVLLSSFARASPENAGNLQAFLNILQRFNLLERAISHCFID